MRVFDLSKDLRLADDKGVEAGRHAEQVTRCIEVDDFVQVWCHGGFVDIMELHQKASEVRPCPGYVSAGGVEF
jgi:hypothetical protein